MTTHAYLVGCGKTKLPHPAPARELYTGPLFQKSLALAERYARERGGDVWVLSAKYGLVQPGRHLSTYDVALTDYSAAVAARWGRWVAADLDAYYARSGVDLERLTLVALAGSAYVGPLRQGLRHHAGLELHVHDPMRGLMVGQRLAWLNAALAVPADPA